jgi:hypothetical protein
MAEATVSGGATNAPHGVLSLDSDRRALLTHFEAEGVRERLVRAQAIAALLSISDSDATVTDAALVTCDLLAEARFQLDLLTSAASAGPNLNRSARNAAPTRPSAAEVARRLLELVLVDRGLTTYAECCADEAATYLREDPTSIEDALHVVRDGIAKSQPRTLGLKLSKSLTLMYAAETVLLTGASRAGADGVQA